MNDVKWIKIVVDIFDDEKIKLIEALPSADTVIVIWFKILCLAGKINNGGILMMNDRIPYTDEMLAVIFRRKVSDVRMALGIFEQYGMIEIIENAYTIPNWSKHQSLDSLENKRKRDREYQRQRREGQKALLEQKDEDGKKSSDNRLTSDDASYSSSYSLSVSFNNTSSNKENYINLVNNYIYKDSEYILNNSRLYKSIEEWFNYKDNKKPRTQHHYDTELGMSKLLTQIVNRDKEYGTDYVLSCIDNAIGNNYQGIAWKKIKQTSESKLREDLERIDNWSPTNDD